MTFHASGKKCLMTLLEIHVATLLYLRATFSAAGLYRKLNFLLLYE